MSRWRQGNEAIGRTQVMRSVLFLSYLFPPRGGAGVQRALKFVKYLPQFGWKPLVVANGGLANDQVTQAQDPTLLKDLPPDTIINRPELTGGDARRFNRMQSKWRQRMKATDPMGWWIRPAVRAGMELFEQHHPAAILVTMSPFTAAEAGIELKRRTKLPLALDLRDPWALDETRIYPSFLHSWTDRGAMKRALNAADLIVMNNAESANAAKKAFKLSAHKVVSITNGFDGEDFDPARMAPVPSAPSDVLRIVHTGMFHSELAKIWDQVNAGGGLGGVVKNPPPPKKIWPLAMEQLIKEAAIPADKLELVLVGELTDGDKALIEASPIKSSVKMLGYRTHEESVGWLMSADVLFLPLHSPLDKGPALIVPGKAYEYLGSGRPILAMGPPGDMRKFVEETDSGIALAGDDVPGAAKAILDLYQAKQRGVLLHTQDRAVVDRFDRRQLTRRLAAALTAMTAQTHPTHSPRPTESPEILNAP
jgi:glycosyltransferase involved in cell wall biosynthesis